MKLGRLSNPLFKEAFERLGQQQLPMRAAYQVKVMSDNFQKDLKRYEELRLELLNKFAAKKEDGSVRSNDRGEAEFDGDNMRLFIEQLTELQALEVEPAPKKIPVEAFGDKVEMSAADLNILEDIIG